jgi:XTP/dITP diphosphohydrolase
LLTVLLTSARVAPGLLSWQAWAALRAASRVLATAGHPQAAALAEAGVAVEAVAGPAHPEGPAEDAALARFLADAVRADPGGAVVWLAAAGAGAPDLAGLEVQVLHGSRDLPGAHLLDVVGVMDTLRTACPWDRRQTHESLAPHLLEEPYEALEALENGDQQALREELGDVLMQVVFHARIAAERPATEDGYTIDDIADTLVAKLVRRHPHVFGGVTVGSADEVISNWDAIKKAERAAKRAAAAGSTDPAAAGPPPSAFDGVVLGQPALSLAAQVLRRAARAGLDGALTDSGSGELGDELLRLVVRAAELGVDPELELRTAVRRLMAGIADD